MNDGKSTLTDLESPPADIALVQHAPAASIDAEANALSITEDEPRPVDAPPHYSALSPSETESILAVASLAAAISPASTTTYYPAVNALSRDLKVSVSLINLSISIYQVTHAHGPEIRDNADSHLGH